MSQIIPTHVLRVGQSVCLSAAEDGQHLGCYLPTSTYTLSWAGCPNSAKSNCGEDDPNSPTLDISLDNLNEMILELDPTFQPLQAPTHGMNKHSGPRTGNSPEDFTQPVKGPGFQIQQTSSLVSSCGVPIPLSAGSNHSPHGSLFVYGSPLSSRPPLPCGSNRIPLSYHCNSPLSCSPGFMPVFSHHRASATSPLSSSPSSDTSYILDSCNSLLSDETDSPERHLFGSIGSLSNVISPYSQCPEPKKPFFADQNLEKSSQISNTLINFSEGRISSSYPYRCPPSVSVSMSDIPVVLINGAPETKPDVIPPQEGPLVCGEGRPHKQILNKNNTPYASGSSSLHGEAGSHASMKFVMDTSQFWFRPHITREEAESLLQEQDPGAFVVRDSTSYRGSFGLAMKVPGGDTNFTSSCQLDMALSQPVRHYLIESSGKGLHLKGSSVEPYFDSLSTLVYQHTINAYALPCKLNISIHVFTDMEKQQKKSQAASAKKSSTKAAYNFLYLNSVTTEMLTGPYAIQKAVSSTFEKENVPTPTIVNLKVSPKGVTLTDIQRKLFFRRHYPRHLLSYCAEDPDSRMWKEDHKSSRIFGFVTKGSEVDAENVCHIFAEYDAQQLSGLAIQLVQDIITGSFAQPHA